MSGEENAKPPEARLKYCDQCGADFLCGPQAPGDNCWCDKLPNIMPLSSAADACLCPSCLNKALKSRLG